jgi:hypothetical protein
LDGLAEDAWQLGEEVGRERGEKGDTPMKGRLSERDMLITLATMAYQDDDFTAHDVIEALKAHGYGDVLYYARSELEARASARKRQR